MQSHSIQTLLENTVEAHGMLDVDIRGEGVSPRRLPAWTRVQIPKMLDIMARMPSGVRLRFATDSSTVGLSFLATNMVTDARERRPITISLEYGDHLSSKTSHAGNTIFTNPEVPIDYRLERGDPDTVVFEDLPSGMKTCELWLPHNAYIELRELLIDEGATISPAETDDRRRWVHYGSSISHCMEAEEPAKIWPAVAARNLGYKVQNLGFGGQCHLDQFVARTIRDLPADIISVKTGINVINMDSMKERIFEPALHGFIDTVREKQESTPFVIISAIYCPAAENHPGPTIPNAEGKFITIPGHAQVREGCMTLSRTRKILKRVVEARRDAGDSNLHYVDGLTLFSEQDADDLPDDLHPNAEGYVRMGERFADIVRTLAL